MDARRAASHSRIGPSTCASHHAAGGRRLAATRAARAVWLRKGRRSDPREDSRAQVQCADGVQKRHGCMRRTSKSAAAFAMQVAAGVAHRSWRGVTRGFLPTRERRGICVTARTASRRKLATVWRDVSTLGAPIWAIVKPALAAALPTRSSCVVPGCWLQPRTRWSPPRTPRVPHAVVACPRRQLGQHTVARTGRDDVERLGWCLRGWRCLALGCSWLLVNRNCAASSGGQADEARAERCAL
jgi:hypothetical protein